MTTRDWPAITIFALGAYPLFLLAIGVLADLLDLWYYGSLGIP